MSLPPPGAFLARQDDDDDVRWNLTTAETQWKRGGHTDAVVWLRRAADAAEAAGAAARADELRAHAAKLAQEVWAETNAEQEVVVELKRPLPPPPPLRSAPPRPSFEPQPQERQSMADLDPPRARIASAPEIVLEEEALDPEELEELLEYADDELEIEVESVPISVEIGENVALDVDAQADLEDDEFENRVTLVPARPEAEKPAPHRSTKPPPKPLLSEPPVAEAVFTLGEGSAPAVPVAEAVLPEVPPSTAALDTAPLSSKFVVDSLPPLEFESEFPPSEELDLLEPELAAPRVPLDASELAAISETPALELAEPVSLKESEHPEAAPASVEVPVLAEAAVELEIAETELPLTELTELELEDAEPAEIEAAETAEPEEAAVELPAAEAAEPEAGTAELLEASEPEAAVVELPEAAVLEPEVGEAELELEVTAEPEVTEPEAEPELAAAPSVEAFTAEVAAEPEDELLEFDLDATAQALDGELEPLPSAEPSTPEVAEPAAATLAAPEPALDLDGPLPELSAWAAGTSVDGVDLCEVRGFEDLPETAQERLAGLARVECLNAGEEVGFFGAAVVTHGQVSVMSAVADEVGAVAVPPDVVFTRGTLEDSLALRMVARMDETRVAVWDAEQLRSVLDECPWVHDELRLAADHFLALCGATLGTLGERLDESLRATVFARLEVKAFLAGEELAVEGKPLPGLFIVSGGRVELSKNGQPVETKSAGDFLFANAIMGGQPSPATAVAGSGGALVLFASRSVAHELMISVPPLLEVLAG